MPKNKAQLYQSLQATPTGCHNSGTAPDKSSYSQIMVHTKERNSSQINDNLEVHKKKKLKNLQLQPSSFYEYVYKAAASFGPKVKPYSGNNKASKWIQTENKFLVYLLSCIITAR